MNTQEVFDKIVAILKPFAKNEEALSGVSMETSLQADLEVNSARLVDIVLEIEDAFGIEVSDDDADQVATVGDAVNLIVATSG
jgi:acyl carrier protein